VLRLFLLEGGLMGLVGSLLGVLWGGGVVAWWARNPLDLSKAIEKEMNANAAISALVYTQFQPSMLLAALAFGVTVAMLASIYPARVASKMVPADAVRAQ